MLAAVVENQAKRFAINAPMLPASAGFTIAPA